MNPKTKALEKRLGVILDDAMEVFKDHDHSDEVIEHMREVVQLGEKFHCTIIIVFALALQQSGIPAELIRRMVEEVENSFPINLRGNLKDNAEAHDLPYVFDVNAKVREEIEAMLS